MVSHLIEQRHDSIWKTESASIFSCSSWRSSQSPHVPFKLERFQFFPLTTGSRICSKERLFQDVEGKGFQVILSLLISLLVFICALLMCFAFILSQSSFCALLYLTCFCLVIFQFCFVLFFIKKFLKKLKNQKNTKTVCVLCILVLAYLGWPLNQSFLNFVSLVA